MSCASTPEWSPKLYHVNHGNLTRKDAKISCQDPKTENYVCMQYVDFDHMYRACWEEANEPWYKIW
jgi:hypothetical protein